MGRRCGGNVWSPQQLLARHCTSLAMAYAIALCYRYEKQQPAMHFGVAWQLYVQRVFPVVGDRHDVVLRPVGLCLGA